MILAVGLASCHAQRGPELPVPPAPAGSPIGVLQGEGVETGESGPSAADAYRIQPGDELAIRLLYDSEFDEKVTVRPDGRFSVPLAHEVVAEGRTPAELAAVLTQQYSRELRDPQVTVVVTSFVGAVVFVGGEVQKPKMQTIPGRLTVLGAIAEAGGFTEDARLGEVLLIRRGLDQRPQVRTLNLQAVVSGKDLSDDLLLQPHDIVYVPRSRIGNVDKFVRQYIRGLLPVSVSVGYRW